MLFPCVFPSNCLRKKIFFLPQREFKLHTEDFFVNKNRARCTNSYGIKWCMFFRYEWKSCMKPSLWAVSPSLYIELTWRIIWVWSLVLRMPQDIIIQLIPFFCLKAVEREWNALILLVFWNDPQCINWTYFPPSNNNICSFHLVFYFSQKVAMV